MPYGQGQQIGTNIAPQLFSQDFSGFARAGEMQGQALQNIGASIGLAAKGIGDNMEKQKKSKQLITASKQTAKAIAQLVPELQPVLQQQLTILDNEEIPISEREAVASSISDILNLGTAEIKSRALMGLEARRVGLQEAHLNQEVLQSQIEQSAKQNENLAKASGIVDAIEILVNEAEAKGEKPVIPKERVEQIRGMVLDNPDAGLGYAKSIYDSLGSTMKKRVDETLAKFVTMGVEGGQQTFQVTPEGLELPKLTPEAEAAIAAGAPPVEGQPLTESDGGVLPDRVTRPGFKPATGSSKESSRQEKLKMLRDARKLYSDGRLDEAADLLNASGAQGVFGGMMTGSDVKDFFESFAGEASKEPPAEENMKRKEGESYADWKKRTGGK